MCTPCPRGFFTPKGDGHAKCEPCRRGSYNTYEAQTSCVSCAEGTENNATGAVSIDSCTPCAPGTVARARDEVQRFIVRGDLRREERQRVSAVRTCGVADDFSGSFALRLLNETTAEIDVLASAQDAASALRALPSFGESAIVNVTKGIPVSDEFAVWEIEFNATLGDVPALVPVEVLLGSCGAIIISEE